jgi:uncharacterized protein YkwD
MRIIKIGAHLLPLPSLWVTVFLLFHGTAALAATQTEIQEWLQAHNNYRAIHGVDPVSWSETIASSAQDYADTCPSGHSGSSYGENLYWATNIRNRAVVVQGWYDENPLYDYNNPGWNPAAGHFTQVVWKGTTEIGCGFKTGCGGDWPNVWVCQYNPPGNYLGQFADNVLPPESGGDNGNEPGGSESLVPIFQLLLLL